MTAILKIDGLYKDFSRLQVLTEVTMEINEGERHMIIGPNGSGKTTLFNIITGFYKPSRGKIFFYDKNITNWSSHKIARLGISRSFQIINIFPKLTVYENVRSAVVSKFNRRFNWTTRLDHNREIGGESDRIVNLLSLTDVREVQASELSYGKQRHLELALTIARDPILIMLDEPTAGLDPRARRSFINLLRDLDQTMLVSTHDMRLVQELFPRTVVMDNGQVVADGPTDSILNDPALLEAHGLEKP